MLPRPEKLFRVCGLYHGIMDDESYYKGLRAHFLIDSALCCYLFKKVITEEDLVDMACYIAKCSNDRLGINHKNRVVKDASERIKRKFEKLSSNSRISALWATYHGFICLINDFIRAERLHDFDLHLAIVAKM